MKFLALLLSMTVGATDIELGRAGQCTPGYHLWDRPGKFTFQLPDNCTTWKYNVRGNGGGGGSPGDSSGTASSGQYCGGSGGSSIRSPDLIDNAGYWGLGSPSNYIARANGTKIVEAATGAGGHGGDGFSCTGAVGASQAANTVPAGGSAGSGGGAGGAVGGLIDDGGPTCLSLGGATAGGTGANVQGSTVGYAGGSQFIVFIGTNSIYTKGAPLVQNQYGVNPCSLPASNGQIGSVYISWP